MNELKTLTDLTPLPNEPKKQGKTKYFFGNRIFIWAKANEFDLQTILASGKNIIISRAENPKEIYIRYFTTDGRNRLVSIPNESNKRFFKLANNLIGEWEKLNRKRF